MAACFSEDTKVFSENFGIVRTEQELDQIVAQHPQYSRSYLAVASAEGKKEHRERIEGFWKVYRLYADENFLEQIKFDFIARCWEMYITCVFLEQGFTVIPKQSSHGPDIQIEMENRSMWVEAVSPKKGTGPDAVPDFQYGVFGNVPEVSILLRFTNALESKFKKYQKYLQDSIIKSDDAFLIAINRGEIDHSTHLGIPLIMKCLFGLGDWILSVPLGGGKPEELWSPREEVHKKKGSSVPTMFFENPEHKGISGVIYCGNDIVNHPSRLGKDCILIHNPNRSSHLPINVLGVGYEWLSEGQAMRRFDRNKKGV